MWPLTGNNTVWQKPPASTGGGTASNVEVRKTESFAVDAAILANKYVDLAEDPVDTAAVEVDVDSGPAFLNGVGYEVIAPRRVSWSGLELDGLLEIGDRFSVTYTYLTE
jgi:hypothetical protein